MDTGISAQQPHDEDKSSSSPRASPQGGRVRRRAELEKQAAQCSWKKAAWLLGVTDQLLSSIGFHPLVFEEEISGGHLILTSNFLGKGPL